MPSNLRFTFDETETKTDANLLLGTVRATFHAIPMTSPVWLSLNGGASLIRRGGEAYEEAEDKSDFGGVVGATVGFRLGSMLSFYVAAEDYIYGARVERWGPREPHPERCAARLRLRVPGRSLISHQDGDSRRPAPKGGALWLSRATWVRSTASRARASSGIDRSSGSQSSQSATVCS